MQRAFDRLKELFTKEPILANHNPEKKSLIKTDILDYLLGGCLSQKHSNYYKPVVYYLRKMMLAELNYNVYNKELLAIVECTAH